MLSIFIILFIIIDLLLMPCLLIINFVVDENEIEANDSFVCDEDRDLCNEDVETNEDPHIEIAKLKKELRRAWQKCYNYKRQLTRKMENFNKVFNDDQLQYLSVGSHRGVKWSHETITKALKLYMACGEKGYEELRKQNLPYPSIRTIQHRLRNLKFQSGILHDVFNLMQLKVSISDDCLSHIVILK